MTEESFRGTLEGGCGSKSLQLSPTSASVPVGMSTLTSPGTDRSPALPGGAAGHVTQTLARGLSLTISPSS